MRTNPVGVSAIEQTAIVTQLCDEWGYLLIGLAAAVPCWLLPLVLPNKADEGRPWHQAYWVKVRRAGKLWKRLCSMHQAA